MVSPLVASFSGAVGRVVAGRFRLLSPIGVGSSSHVYLADDVENGGHVAVKLLRPELAGDDRFVRRFHRETRAAAALEHPHVLRIVEVGEDPFPYLVCEHMAGGSLYTLLAAGHRLSPAQAALVGLQACQGLAFAHSQGFVHRDVKPANLLFGSDGQLRIADFGIARAVAEASVTEADGSFLGTLRYSSPEQARGEGVDGRSDVYSLALVLIEAVSGELPFLSDSPAATLLARTERDVPVAEEIGPLREPLERAGRLDRGERADIRELEAALLSVAQRCEAPGPLPLSPPTEVVETGPRTDERPAVAAVPVPAAGHGTEPADAAGGAGVQPAVATPDVADDEEPDALDEPRSGRRRGVLLVLVAVAAALLAGAGGVLFWDAVRTPVHEVPDLVGQDEEDARAVAESFEWELRVSRDRQDGSEPGEILATTPARGSDLEEGETLLITVSEGNTLVAVPADLENRPLAEVGEELAEAGLEAAVVRSHHEELPIDTVISVPDDLPDRLPKGSEVPLSVSSGPAPRTVPDDLAGVAQDTVVERLRDLGLEVEVVRAFSETVGAGRVVSTEPSGGVQVERGSTVEVTVSRGPELVTVPDVSGAATLERAAQVLRDAGLRPGQVFGPASGSPELTEPRAGSDVRRGASVDVYLT